MPLAPIILFVYKRPVHTEKVLTALAQNDLAAESELYIYCDGPKDNASATDIEDIKETREIIRQKKWCKEVHIRESSINKGLANSVITGVTEILNKYNEIIVLEDDLVCHPFFLTYMNKYLDIYSRSESVISIHGFMYPVSKKIASPFFIKGADCWGWATWKRGWELFVHDSRLLLDQLSRQNLINEFNFNNSYNYASLLSKQAEEKVDSWAIRWYASAFLQNKLTLYPPVSLVQNIGFDGSGTHGDNNIHLIKNTFDFKNFEIKEVDIKEDKRNRKIIETYFRGKNHLLKSIKNRLMTFYRKNKF